MRELIFTQLTTRRLASGILSTASLAAPGRPAGEPVHQNLGELTPSPTLLASTLNPDAWRSLGLPRDPAAYQSISHLPLPLSPGDLPDHHWLALWRYFSALIASALARGEHVLIYDLNHGQDACFLYRLLEHDLQTTDPQLTSESQRDCPFPVSAAQRDFLQQRLPLWHDLPHALHAANLWASLAASLLGEELDLLDAGEIQFQHGFGKTFNDDWRTRSRGLVATLLNRGVKNAPGTGSCWLTGIFREHAPRIWPDEYRRERSKVASELLSRLITTGLTKPALPISSQLAQLSDQATLPSLAGKPLASLPALARKKRLHAVNRGIPGFSEIENPEQASEAALYSALFVALYAEQQKMPLDQALQLAINHSGPSDLVGTLAGLLLGARQPHPAPMRRLLTNLEELDEIGRSLVASISSKHW